jgi:hypothetical protein
LICFYTQTDVRQKLPKKKDRKVEQIFISSSRYIDDVLSLGAINPKDLNRIGKIG